VGEREVGRDNCRNSNPVSQHESNTRENALRLLHKFLGDTFEIKPFRQGKFQVANSFLK